MLMRNPNMPKGHLVVLDGTQYDVENGFIEVPSDAPREHVEQISAHGFELARSPAARSAQTPTPQAAPQLESQPEFEPRKRGEVFTALEPEVEPEPEELRDDLPADAGDRCLGVKRDGTRCNLHPMHGELYCHLHQSQAD